MVNVYSYLNDLKRKKAAPFGTALIPRLSRRSIYQYIGLTILTIQSVEKRADRCLQAALINR
ncbi:hypothetical protein PhaeoP78_03463 (plasmid) [Phaeobacter inhibens]|nr:hypothetical protein PhaeoP78_03463 [Phaeobacter inhibens]